MRFTASAKYLNVRPSDLRENKPVSLIIFLRPADQHCRKSSRNHLFKSTYMVQITLIRRSWVASGSVLRRGLSEMHDPHPPACPPPSGAHSCKNCGTEQKRKSLWWSDANTQSIQREIGWTFSERFPLDLLQIALEAIFQQHSNSALGEAHKIYCGRFYCYHLMRISTQIGAFIKRRTLRWLYTDGGWGRWPLLAVAAPGPEENPTRAYRRRRTHKNMHDAAGKINK